MSIQLDREGDVFLLRMDSDENRFSPAMVQAFGEALDEVEAAEGPKALVTTGAGRFYSNGLDLEWLLGEGRSDAQGYIGSVLALMSRILVFPAFTVSAINGHAFGAGAQLAVAHDLRLMRTDRGFFCMPEVDMRVALHPGMTALLAARLPTLTAHEVIVTGRRIGGEDAVRMQIAAESHPENALLAVAMDRAAELAGKADPAMSALKRGLYPHVLEALAASMPLDD